jgi:16S rRNA (guanine527-N7)-methyltransferase
MEASQTKLEIIFKYFADFSPRQVEQLTALYPLYEEWNSKINVISRKDMEGLYEKHVLHSLAIAAVADMQPGMQVIDIGTGGGFPGIPLAIFYPEVRFHLVDSIGKKLKVVEAVAEAIDLTNVTTQHIRAEEIKGRKFNYVVTRAVAPLKELWQWSKPLLRKQHPPGIMNPLTDEEELRDDQLILPPSLICLKGGDLHQEISDSGCRPLLQPVTNIFPEENFRDKFVLVVKNG